jgi:hypothetical protein
MSGSYYTLDAKYNSLLSLIQQNATTGNTLEAVLTQGNDAGGQDITNVNNVDLVTINGSAYPPVVAGDDLEQVLTNGNDAGGLSMTNLNDVGLTTINGTAYPPVVADNTLTEVLTAGNSASGLSITGVNDIALTTINGSAYPPPSGGYSSGQFNTFGSTIANGGLLDMPIVYQVGIAPTGGTTITLTQTGVYYINCECRFFAITTTGYVALGAKLNGIITTSGILATPSLTYDSASRSQIINVTTTPSTLQFELQNNAGSTITLQNTNYSVFKIG